MSLRNGARLVKPLKPSAISVRAIHQTTRRSFGAPESHYDPPTGWLFGVKPGEKYQKEGWENIFIYGFFGSVLFGGVGYAFKPDSS